MINVVTSITTWNDAVGKRMSISYSKIDEETGRVISDNKRLDRVVTDPAVKAHADALAEFAQSIIDTIE